MNICFFITEMIKLNEKYEVDRKILICDYIKYSSSKKGQ